MKEYIRDEEGNLLISKAPVEAMILGEDSDQIGVGERPTTYPNKGKIIALSGLVDSPLQQTSVADAFLIEECFNTTNKYNKTPAELVETIRGLWDTLQKICPHQDLTELYETIKTYLEE